MSEERKVAPGWYDHDGGLRYWDGKRWTDNYAPNPPQSRDTDAAGRFVRAVLATWAGVLLGWGTIYLGAQADPDTFYWPIKVVVEESDVPPALR